MFISIVSYYSPHINNYPYAAFFRTV